MSEGTLPQTYGNPNTISTASMESVGVGAVVAGSFASTAWGTANLIMYYPFSLSRSLSVVRMGWSNGTTVAGNVVVGVYNDAWALLGSCTSTAQATVSVGQFVTVTAFNVPVGRRHYLALTASDATATFGMFTTPPTGLCAGVGIMSELGTGGLPGTATPTVPTAEWITQVFISSETTL